MSLNSIYTNNNPSSLNFKSRLYSSKISEQSLFIIRRIAWATGRPMTRSLDQVIAAAIQQIDLKAVCKACKDNLQCSSCPFETQLLEYPDIERLLKK